MSSQNNLNGAHQQIISLTTCGHEPILSRLLSIGMDTVTAANACNGTEKIRWVKKDIHMQRAMGKCLIARFWLAKRRHTQTWNGKKSDRCEMEWIESSFRHSYSFNLKHEEQCGLLFWCRCWCFILFVFRMSFASFGWRRFSRLGRLLWFLLAAQT